MDNEKEKEIEFKPSTWLYIFLFIYYSVWLMQSFGALTHYFTFGFDSFLTFSSLEWMYFALFLLAGVYSFYAIIKTLRGDRDCITSLKWSLILVFIYTLMDPIRGQIATYDILTWSVAFCIRPLFYLIFYLYLCFAKGIKRRYPKDERRFGPSGWIWSGLITSFICVGIYGGWQQYQVSQYCKRIDLASMMLSPGEVTDGYVLFQSDRKWEKWIGATDTLYIDDRIETLPTLMSVDSVSRIYLASGRSERPDARTYNQVLVASMSFFSEKINGNYGKVKELSFTDTIVSEKRLMSTTYETIIDSVPAYFDVLMLSDIKSPKCCVVCYVDKRPIIKEWAIDFADGLQFDLNNITKGKDDENCDNPKYENSHRTAYGKHKSESNMLASLFQRISPSHLFCIMALKHYEGEITDRKCENVF